MYDDIKVKHSGSKQLSKNPLIERLTHTHIAVPVSLYFLMGAGLLAYDLLTAELTAWVIVVLFFTGLLTFTFVEYWLHREVYHMKTNTESRKKIQYLMHGIHHEYPKDKTRLALPPVIGVAVALILLGIFYVLMGKFAYAFFPGFIWGYAGYLFVHYIVHAYPPPKNAFKALWVNHALHHYKDGKQVFGVSSPLWDYIFKTMPTEKETVASHQH
jgi:sterol desaturase/sphingolipid hydroxylase (fatty acid hydroxylase superfamily)